MEILHTILVVLQIISAVALIFIIATQTTKSEQSGGNSGLGWGTIGGQASSTVKKFGLDAQLTRITTILAISFFALSFIAAVVETNIR